MGGLNASSSTVEAPALPVLPILIACASAMEEPPDLRPTEIAVLLPAVTAALFFRMSLPGLFESDFLYPASVLISPVVYKMPDLLFA